MLFTQEQLLKKADKGLSDEFGFLSETKLFSKAKEKLLEKAEVFSGFEGSQQSFNIFLSHSTNDAREVLGLYDILVELGYSVYVDWIENPELNRKDVTKHNAQIIKDQMRNSDSLFFAYSINAKESVWMPWELGYFDGLKGKAAILPISKHPSISYAGSEYLKLYYYITKETSKNGRDILWVNESINTFVAYDEWISKDTAPYLRA